MKKKIVVARASVMSIVEGITVSIAQHSGVPFEKIWASSGDMPKLDIYYREAVSDLERQLTTYIDESSPKFDLQAIGDDYCLELALNGAWPTKLEGLLKNKIQDYLVHSVAAGWLNDFADLNVKQDYRAMATSDAKDIVYILGKKQFGFGESERADGDDKANDKTDTEVTVRGLENDKPEESGSAVSTRASESGKAQEDSQTETSQRGSENDKMAEGNSFAVSARSDKAEADKMKEQEGGTVMARHEDNAEVKHHCNFSCILT